MPETFLFEVIQPGKKTPAVFLMENIPLEITKTVHSTLKGVIFRWKPKTSRTDSFSVLLSFCLSPLELGCFETLELVMPVP